MVPTPDPVLASETVPARTDVVVVGGGIVGVSAALTLAERGVAVTLCEKGRVAGEQSGRNWGWVRKMGRDPAELPLAIESLKLWEGMTARVEAETGFRHSGIAYLCRGDAAMAHRSAWLEHARAFDLDTRMLTPAEVAELMPGAARDWDGALYTRSDGVAEPQKAAPAIANAAIRRGASILVGCAVRGIETEAGRIAGVVTERGPIRCNAVVVAGGAWSRLFCGNLDINLPQLGVISSVLCTEPFDGPPTPAASSGTFAFRKRLDGGYTIAQPGANIAPIVPDSFRQFFTFLPELRARRSELRLRLGRPFIDALRTARRWTLDRPSPFEVTRVLDPVPNTRFLDQARTALAAEFPAFASVRVARSWAGVIDATPDSLPVIGPVAALPGLYIATGFSGHGFGIGPGAGALVADLVTGDPPLVDPAPLRFSRFRRDDDRSE